MRYPKETTGSKIKNGALVYGRSISCCMWMELFFVGEQLCRAIDKVAEFCTFK